MRLVRDATDVAIVNPESGEISRGMSHTILDYAQVVAEIEAALAAKKER